LEYQKIWIAKNLEVCNRRSLQVWNTKTKTNFENLKMMEVRCLEFKRYGMYRVWMFGRTKYAILRSLKVWNIKGMKFGTLEI
jgi:hypothetical protein